MFELFALIILWKNVGEKMLAKGRSPAAVRFLAVLLWFSGEIAGIILAACFLHLLGRNVNNHLFLTYLGALPGVLLALLITYAIVYAARPATCAALPGPLAASHDLADLHNLLRKRPTDSIRLLHLMQMYIELGAPDHAAAVASAFPNSLFRSDHCLTLLAAIHAGQNRHDEAQHYASAALALNAGNPHARQIHDFYRTAIAA